MSNDLWDGREVDEDDHIYKEKRISPQFESNDSSILPILISFVFVITLITILVCSIISNS